jgi:hypothetical protein
LTANYPASPLTLACNRAPLSLPLIECWVKTFTLEDVVGQLFVIAQSPTRARYQ